MTKNPNGSSSAIQPGLPQIPTTSISAAGMTVEYFAVGSGEPILFLHCTGGSSRQWHPFAEGLRGHFQVIAPDLCGYGGTSRWPGSERFGLANEVALVTALIDRLGKPMHLVGHSYGGAVALQIARRSPECLSSLTLIEPAAFHLLIDGDNADELAFDEIMDIAATIARAVNCGYRSMLPCAHWGRAAHCRKPNDPGRLRGDNRPYPASWRHRDLGLKQRLATCRRCRALPANR